MPKSDTIDAIRKLNPTANPEFLCEFCKDELDRYLDRLDKADLRRSVRGAGDLLGPFNQPETITGAGCDLM